MDQFIVNIEPGADTALLRKIIRNIKGIGEVELKRGVDVKQKKKMKKNDPTEEWIKKMRSLSNSIDTSMIDRKDDRTRYILSK